MNYITTTYFLDRLKTVKIINNPIAIINISEKLFSHEFKKYMPPYIFTSRISDIREFLKNKHIIIKPIHSYGGNSINKLKIKLIKFFN